MNLKTKKAKAIMFLCVILLFVLLIFLFVFFYSLFSAKKEYYINEKNIQIPIYTYHQIVESSADVEVDYMQTTLKNFKKQINGLLNLGYTPITYQNLIDYKKGIKSIPKKSCIITFDDGYTSVYEYVYPVVEEYNIPITLFVVNNLVGVDGYMTWDQLKEMHDSKLVDIYSHGLNHSEYDKLGTDILLSETEESYSELKNKLEDTSLLKIFAYPCGFYTDDEIEILANNGYIQNLMDGKINKSNSLNLNKLHRLYPLNDSILKMIFKQIYKSIKYTN